MDNVFEILIYLLIIISFLSGLFRKKNKQKRPPVQRPQNQDESYSEPAPVQNRQKEEYDVLKEIEDFFKVGDEQTETHARQTEPPEEVKQADFEEHVQSDEWHQPTASEHKYTDVWKQKEKEVRKVKSKVDSEIEQQAVKFEKHLTQAKTGTSDLSRKIIDTLSKPASLKDYVVISEIMSKPKSLRR